MIKRLTTMLLVITIILCSTGIGEAAGTLRLKKGSHGEAVETLQTALKEQGYYGGKIDGIYGKETVSAVKAFQKANGLKVDGIAGPKTLEVLYEPKGVKGAMNDTVEQGIGTAAFYDPNMAASVEFATATPDKIPEEAAAFLQNIVNRCGVACGTVLLSKNGQIFLCWSFGGVDEYTCFRIASITKWVTAIGLMTLYDEGKLDLDRDIGDYLGFKVRNPAFPDKAITARMLLSHTSSLSPDASDYHPDWSRIGKKGYDPIFNEAVEPGTVYAYADYNGALFGCLIEAISGESVQNYLSRKVFTPLGLTAGYAPQFLPEGTECKDLLKANGSVEISVAKDRKRNYNNKADPKGNNGYTVGKLYINADSLTKLAQMMLYGGELNGVRILKTDTVKLMESDQKGLGASRYGLSTVRLNQFDRGTWYGHQGRYSGLSSNIYYQRETGITMALIMNGYVCQLQDNIVTPAVSILTNMEKLEQICLGE